MLATQPASTAQRLYDWALLLHAGEGAWWTWAVLLGLTGASIPLFLISGLLIWWRTRQDRPHHQQQSAGAGRHADLRRQRGGGTPGAFAETLHDALVRAGHRVHSAPLEHFGLGPPRPVFVLAATYGEGQAPAHAGGR